MKSFIFYVSVFIVFVFPCFIYGENFPVFHLDLQSSSDFLNYTSSKRKLSIDNSLFASMDFNVREVKTFASFNFFLEEEKKPLPSFTNGYLLYNSFSKEKFFSIPKILIGNFSINKTASRFKKPQFNFPDSLKSSNLTAIGFGFSLPTTNSSSQNFGLLTLFCLGKINPLNIGLHWCKDTDNLNSFSSLLSKVFKFSKNSSLHYTMGLNLNSYNEIKSDSWWLDAKYFHKGTSLIFINEIKTLSKLTQGFISHGIGINPYNKVVNYLRGEFSVKTSFKNPFFLGNFGLFICDNDYFTTSENFVKEIFKIYINPQFQFFLGKGKSFRIKIGFLSGMSINQETNKSKNRFYQDIWKMSFNINYFRFDFLGKSNFENMFYFYNFSSDKPEFSQSLQIRIRCPWEDLIFRYYTVFVSYENYLQKSQNNGTWNFRLKGNFNFDITNNKNKTYKLSIRSTCGLIYKNNIESWELEGKLQINKFTTTLEGILPVKESSRQSKVSISLSWQIL